MRTTKEFEFPSELIDDLEKAKRLEIITIIYLISVVAVMYITMGSSQAMKTAWLEDALSLIPSLSFLTASKIFHKKPDRQHPYGYHRVTTISFLCGSLALSGMGVYLFIDSIIKLISAEHPTIGSIEIFGQNMWQGWAMMAALIYSAVPAVVLGLKKIPLAKKLHDKILFTDAEMNKADWMTAAAAFLGVLGIGFGIWWADSAAASLISIDIIYDGYGNLKTAVLDLMDRIPLTVDHKRADPVFGKLENFFNELDWVEKAELRLREEGHVYFGEVLVIPKNNTLNLIDKIRDAEEKASSINWKIYDLVIMPVKKIP
jgi:cation diffusion facilitator family transporter